MLINVCLLQTDIRQPNYWCCFKKKLGLLRGMKEKQKDVDVTKQTTHQHHDVKLS